MNRLWPWLLISLILSSPFVWQNNWIRSAWREAQTWVGASPSSATADGEVPEGEASWTSTLSGFFGGTPGNRAEKKPIDPTATAAVYPPIPDSPTAPRLEGPSVADFREVFRFDMTADEITKRWARVTSLPADGQLEALRVTLVTGIKVDDLAGSLTYFFDSQRRLQRMQFTGTTGDASRLVELAKKEFQLKSEPSAAATLYAARRGRRPHSFLGIEHASLMRADHPNQRLNIFLELNNPRGSGAVSVEGQAWLTAHTQNINAQNALPPRR